MKAFSSPSNHWNKVPVMMIVLLMFLFTGFQKQTTASPLCPSSPTTFGYEYVSSITINGQTRQGNTGYSGPGYMDYSGSSLTTMVAGNTYPVSVTVVTNTTWHEYVKIWFDFNGNQNLLDPGELVFDQNHTWSGVHTFSGNITVPPTAYNGEVYLRVIMVYAAVPQLCGSYSYGNTLDFKVNITGGVTPRTLSVSKAGSYQGNVSSSPSGINTSGGYNTANFGDGSNVTLTASNVPGGQFTGWSGSVSGTSPSIVVPMNSNMNVVANFAADVPADLNSITAADNILCLGETTQLTANGSDGTVQWYAGSCGGTLIGTGNSIQVSPTSNTTYYARNYNNGHYSANCASVSISVSTLDSDGDGIADDCDLDDDNDGILDTDECTTSNFHWSNSPSISGNTATGTINGVQYTYTSSENVTSTSYIYNHGIFPAQYNVPNVNPTIQNIYVTNNTLTFASPMTNPVLVFASIGNSGAAVPITFSNPVEVLWSSAVTVNSPTKITGVEGYAIVRMNGTFSNISFNYDAAENWVNFAFGADFYTYCDTDGDGITDNLDLDSDNDGCYDAIEGSLGLSELQAPNGRLTGPVAANGIPLLAGNDGQEVGTSINASANCFCELGIDNTIPVVKTKDNTVYLDAAGHASITPQAVDNGSYDNCGSVSLSLDDMTFDCSDMNAKNVATIVSDNTWSQSTVELTTPGQYVTVVNQLPDVNTYTLSASNAWPYGTVNFFSPAIPDAQPIYASGGTKFYRNDFQLTGRPQSLRIRARVDNMMEIFVNGVSIGMEDDVDGANFSNTIYHDVYIDDNGVQNGYLGGMQFDVVTSQSILDLLHEGSNEIVFAIANTNGTDEGGFMVRMDAVADGVPVVLTAVDPNGNSSDATAFVVVKDNLAPAISTQPISLTLPASGTVSITANDVATVTDNCSVATVELSQYVFGINDALNSPVTVIVTATDASGNVSSQPVEVSVIDPVPVALCQDITVELDENGFVTITPEMINNGSSSEVGIADLTLDITSFDCSDTGANPVTLTVTSTLGTTATCSATVTVVDQIAPVITCPSNIQVNNTPSQCGANVNFTASVTDNCSTTLTYSHQPNSFFPIGITPVSITATDAAGNMASCTFNVEVVDVELPSISCPFDIVINTQPGVCGAVVNYELPTGNDNCGTQAPPTSIPDHTFKGYHNGHTYFLSNSMVPPETAHANALAAGGYLATIADAQENQFISNMYPDRIWIGFTDRDQEGVWRWITNEPVNYTNWSAGEPNNAGNEDWAVINWSGPTWNDWYYTQPAYYVIEFGGGGIPANLVAGLPSGSVFPVGTTEVTYEVLDPSGNRVECTFNVTVNDNQAPVAVAQNLELQLDANGQATLTAAQVDNGSSDNCGIASLSINKTTFDCSNVGANTVTLTVTDVNGLVSSSNSIVTVVDQVAPVAAAQNITVQLDATGSASITASQIDDGSTDACGIASIELSQTDFDCSNVGLNTVTLTVTDIHGNVATANAVVTVQDIIAPNVVAQDVVVQLDENGYGFLTPEMVDNGSTDACGIASLSLDNTTFDCSDIGVSNQSNAYAVQLDGINDYLNLGDMNNELDYTQMATFQVWLKPITNNGQYRSFLEVNSDNVHYLSMESQSGANQNKISWYVTGGLATTANDVLANNQWVNVTTVYDGTQANAQDRVKIYINGVDQALVYNGTIPTNAGPLGNLVAGSQNGVSQFSNTEYDEIRVWKRALTPAEVQANWNQTLLGTETDLVGYFTFENGPGSTYASDLSSSGNDAFLTNMAPNEDWVTGAIGLNVGNTSVGVAVKLTATDVNGNSASATANVTVVDNLAPVALTKDITVQLDESGSVSITPEDVDNGSADNCGVESLALDITSFDCSNVGTNTVTLTVSDVNGNVSTVDAVVTVEDNVAPVALAQDLTIQLDELGVASITPEMVDNGSNDACGIASLALSQLDFDCSHVGPNTITLTVTDVNGNVSTVDAVVTVEDVTPPVVLVKDITVQLDVNGQVAFSVNDIDDGSYDVCGIAQSNMAQTPLTCENIGENTITLELTDLNGNTASASAVVTVEDNVAPVALAQNITIQLDELGAASITPEMVDNGSNDACGIASLALSQLDFDCSHVGLNTITLTVTDVNGNVSTIDAVVTVEDNIAPSLTVPADIVQLNDPLVCGALIELGEAITADNCAVASVVNDSPGFFGVGETTVTWTVTDVNGNTTTSTQQVVITNDLPLIDELQVDTNIERDELVTASATFTDNNVLYATFEWGDGSTSDGVINGQSITGDHVYTETGLYTVNLIVEDACGEIASMTYTYVMIWSACEGKLTAGGWMNYLPGNWLEYPAQSGKAKFEINAQYKKHGGLEGKFNFEIKTKGTDLKLKSTNLDWLMINDNWAVLSGSAKVGKQYGYTFQVAVIDGGNGHHATGPNNIRVIVWDPSGNVIFDNEQSLAIDQHPSTEIGRGSIQIHKKDNDCDDEHANNDKDKGKDRDDDNDDENDDDHSWTDQFKSCNIYPNPVDNDLNLRFDNFDDDHIYYTISDSKGRKYASKVKMNIYGGQGKTKVNQYRLRKGTYVITIQDEDGKNSRSMPFIKK